MANVLPQEIRKQIRAMNRARFILAGSLVVIVCSAATILALLPSYVALSSSAPQEPALIEGLEGKLGREDIKHTELILKDLAVIATSTPALDAIEAAIAARPEGIRITFIGFEPGDENIITLSGTSLSRERLNAFATQLRADSHFKNVVIPLAVLAGTDDAYSMTLMGNF